MPGDAFWVDQPITALQRLMALNVATGINSVSIVIF